MMEKLFRQSDSHPDAELLSQQDDNQLSMTDRFNAFMIIMAPYYAAAGRLQRIYRVDDCQQRSVCDDWGLRLQPLPQSARDR